MSSSLDNLELRMSQRLDFAFSHRTSANRLLKAALTERLASWNPADRASSGIPTERLINLYSAWARGGYGVILTGNVIIDTLNLESAGNMIVPPSSPFGGERFEMFRRLAAAGKESGSLMVAQLSHAGRQCAATLNPDPVSASDVKLGKSSRFGTPHPASQREIDQIVSNFAHSARYLEAAGFDGVQIHGAHGYLLAQFLSRTTNRRTDAYGSQSIENRARLICEVAREIRRCTQPGFVLGIKMNSVEFQADGLQPEEAAQLCEILERETFDFVELSGGNYESFGFRHARESTVKREAFFIEFAEMIVPRVKKLKVYMTGGLRTANGIENALKVVDGVGLGRPITQEYELGQDFMQGKKEGALVQIFDQADFGITSMVSNTQMRQISDQRLPFDGASKQNVNRYLEEAKAWAKAKQKDIKGEIYLPLDVDVEGLAPLGSGDDRAKPHL